MGLRPAATIHPAAYLASRVDTSILTEMFLQYNWNLKDSKFFQDNFCYLQAYIPDLSLDSLFGASPNLQHNLQKKLTDIAFANYLEQLDSASKANALSYTLPHACDYLSAPPLQNLSLTMSSQEFTIAICRQLRLPLYDAVSVCPSCKNTLLDTFGDPSIVCSASGDRIWRHNAVRDQVFHTCKAAHLSPQIESRVNFTSQHRPADVLLPNWSCGRPLAIDVTITSPL